MKNTFGNGLQVTIFGESHGPYIGAVLDGLTPGMPVDTAFIKERLSLRRPAGRISTSRVEADDFSIVSGVFEGRTAGTPLCILIPNSSQKSGDYSKTASVARPGHADFTANCKYHGFQDYRGGGHFSGRITAALVAAGAIVLPALKSKGITIGSHIRACAGIADSTLASDEKILVSQLEALSKKRFAVLDENAGQRMKEAIAAAAKDGDSVGGIIETAVTGLESGLGEPWFDSMESLLSHVLFSIPAVKGIQFGLGFDMASQRGSFTNDPFTVKDGRVITVTNNNGGINGGLTNGMPLVLSCAVKPTPSIYKKQQTADFKTNENTELSLEGRHDPAIVHRAVAVVDSAVALVLYDVLISRHGTDFFADNVK